MKKKFYIYQQLLSLGFTVFGSFSKELRVENAYKSMKLVLLTCNVVSKSQYNNVHNNILLPNAQQSYSNHLGICPWSQSLD